MVLLVFLVLLIAVPLVELYLIFQVAHAIGVLESVALLVVISVVGGWIVRTAGVRVPTRGLAQAAQGRMPTDEIINGGVVLVAGALMLTPGFLTDAVGLLLLLPLGLPLGMIYYAGIAVISLMIAWEHHLVKPGDLSKLNAAFFNMNGYISVTIFCFTLADVLL